MLPDIELTAEQNEIIKKYLFNYKVEKQKIMDSNKLLIHSNLHEKLLDFNEANILGYALKFHTEEEMQQLFGFDFSDLAINKKDVDLYKIAFLTFLERDNSSHRTKDYVVLKDDPDFAGRKLITANESSYVRRSKVLTSIGSNRAMIIPRNKYYSSSDQERTEIEIENGSGVPVCTIYRENRRKKFTKNIYIISLEIDLHEQGTPTTAEEIQKIIERRNTIKELLKNYDLPGTVNYVTNRSVYMQYVLSHSVTAEDALRIKKVLAHRLYVHTGLIADLANTSHTILHHAKLTKHSANNMTTIVAPYLWYDLPYRTSGMLRYCTHYINKNKESFENYFGQTPLEKKFSSLKIQLQNLVCKVLTTENDLIKKYFPVESLHKYINTINMIFAYSHFDIRFSHEKSTSCYSTMSCTIECCGPVTNTDAVDEDKDNADAKSYGYNILYNALKFNSIIDNSTMQDSLTAERDEQSLMNQLTDLETIIDFINDLMKTDEGVIVKINKLINHLKPVQAYIYAFDCTQSDLQQLVFHNIIKVKKSNLSSLAIQHLQANPSLKQAIIDYVNLPSAIGKFCYWLINIIYPFIYRKAAMVQDVIENIPDDFKQVLQELIQKDLLPEDFFTNESVRDAFLHSEICLTNVHDTVYKAAFCTNESLKYAILRESLKNRLMKILSNDNTTENSKEEKKEVLKKKSMLAIECDWKSIGSIIDQEINDKLQQRKQSVQNTSLQNMPAPVVNKKSTDEINMKNDDNYQAMLDYPLNTQLIPSPNFDILFKATQKYTLNKLTDTEIRFIRNIFNLPFTTETRTLSSSLAFKTILRELGNKLHNLCFLKLEELTTKKSVTHQFYRENRPSMFFNQERDCNYAKCIIETFFSFNNKPSGSIIDLVTWCFANPNIDYHMARSQAIKFLAKILCINIHNERKEKNDVSMFENVISKTNYMFNKLATSLEKNRNKSLSSKNDLMVLKDLIVTKLVENSNYDNNKKYLQNYNDSVKNTIYNTQALITVNYLKQTFGWSKNKCSYLINTLLHCNLFQRITSKKHIADSNLKSRLNNTHNTPFIFTFTDFDKIIIANKNGTLTNYQYSQFCIKYIFAFEKIFNKTISNWTQKMKNDFIKAISILQINKEVNENKVVYINCDFNKNQQKTIQITLVDKQIHLLINVYNKSKKLINNEQLCFESGFV